MDQAVIERTFQIVKPVLPAGIRLGVFGSRVSGRPAKYSDIDVVVSAGDQPVLGGVFENIRQVLEESDLPYRVDVVDINNVSGALKKQILAEVIWT